MMPSWGPTLSRLIPNIWFENVDFLLIEDERVLIGDNSNEFPETILDCFFGDKRAINIGDPSNRRVDWNVKTLKVENIRLQ